MAASTVTVYRCPGPPVHYTDALTAAQAQARQCVALLDQPVSVGRAPALAARGAASAAGAQGAAASGAQDQRVRAEEQRQRDAAAREILQTELRREEARLTRARQAQDAAAVARAEADIEAIRRELTRRR